MNKRKEEKGEVKKKTGNDYLITINYIFLFHLFHFFFCDSVVLARDALQITDPFLSNYVAEADADLKGDANHNGEADANHNGEADDNHNGEADPTNNVKHNVKDYADLNGEAVKQTCETIPHEKRGFQSIRPCLLFTPCFQWPWTLPHWTKRIHSPQIRL